MAEKNGREKLKEQVLEELRGQLSKDELQRIKQQREFQSISRDTNSFPLGLAVDPLRLQLRKAKSIVEKSLWQIQNLGAKINRIDADIASDNITEELRPGVLMNEEEATLQKKYSEWLIEGELQSLPMELWQMRGVVGQHDMAGNVIISEEEFDAYLSDVKERVKRMGHVLF